MKTHTPERPIAGNPPANLDNGLVGLRVDPIPLPRGTALVSGFVGLSPEKATEESADALYPAGAATFSLAPRVARVVATTRAE